MGGQVQREVRSRLGQIARRDVARQKKLGVIPGDCDLTVRPQDIPAWDAQTPELKRVLAREMEVYAGFLEYADHEARYQSCPP